MVIQQFNGAFQSKKGHINSTRSKLNMPHDIATALDYKALISPVINYFKEIFVYNLIYCRFYILNRDFACSTLMFIFELIV